MGSGAVALSGLSLRDLEYLIALAEHRHFGRAAEACHVSQPALSAQIRKLEELLRVRLFERTRQGVAPTRHGERILAQARRVVREAAHLLELARSLGEPLAGPFALGAIETLGPYLFPHLLRPLCARFPRMELALSEGRTGELIARLISWELDAVLVASPVHHPAVRLESLFVEPLLFLHRPDEPLARKRPLKLADLAGERLLLLEEGHCLREQALRLCGMSAAVARRHATGLETLRHMVAAGAGYSIIPALAARPPAELSELLATTPFDDPEAGRTIALAFRESDPRADALLLFAQVLREIAPPGVRVTPGSGSGG